MINMRCYNTNAVRYTRELILEELKNIGGVFRMKKGKAIWFIIAVALLVVSNGYWIINSAKPDHTIRIGKPTVDDNNIITSIDFSQSESLRRKGEVDTILFSLLGGNNISKPSIVNEAPDAVLLINASAGYGIVFQAVLWLDGENVIFSMGSTELSQYKQIDHAVDLIALVEEHMKPYS